MLEFNEEVENEFVNIAIGWSSQSEGTMSGPSMEEEDVEFAEIDADEEIDSVFDPNPCPIDLYWSLYAALFELGPKSTKSSNCLCFFLTFQWRHSASESNQSDI